MRVSTATRGPGLARRRAARRVARCIEVYSDRTPWRLYALLGAGPAGSTVFAKCRHTSMAATERPCYERLLPGLAVATPRCYGCIDDGEYGWLLLQAVEGAPYDESNRDHLAMAARWLAAMHGLPCRWGAPRRYRTLAPTDISPTSLADERGWKGAWAIPGPSIRWAGGPWRSSLSNSMASKRVGTPSADDARPADRSGPWRLQAEERLRAPRRHRARSVRLGDRGLGTACCRPDEDDVNADSAAVRETWADVSLESILEWATWVVSSCSRRSTGRVASWLPTPEALAPPLDQPAAVGRPPRQILGPGMSSGIDVLRGLLVHLAQPGAEESRVALLPVICPDLLEPGQR